MSPGSNPAALRAGLLGPGRTRNGLGPFIARWFEQAGVEVVATAGRDPERARAANQALADSLGHAIEARDGLAALLAPGDLDLLIIAAPVEAHRDALVAALTAGLHVFCEKPFVDPRQTDAVAGLCERFTASGLVLQENCQWPEFLSALDALYPDRPTLPLCALDMRLSPSGTGRAGLADSLSHYLSLLQALAPVDHATRLTRCELSTRAESAAELALDLGFAGPFDEVRGRFELVQVVEQPRPAWFAVDGCRVDREIDMETYAFAARGGERRIPMDDPLARLVYRFVETVRKPDHERIQREAERISVRARLYREILETW